jgi:hypothetical protein
MESSVVTTTCYLSDRKLGRDCKKTIPLRQIRRVPRQLIFNDNASETWELYTPLARRKECKCVHRVEC